MSDNNAVSQTPSPRGIQIRGAIYGAIGAFLGVIPVSILKTFAAMMRLCVPLMPHARSSLISLSTCGLLYDTTESTTAACSAYLAFATLCGALAGYLATLLRSPGVPATPGATTETKPPSIFWRCFGAGVLFDLVFVFVFMYIGQ